MATACPSGVLKNCKGFSGERRVTRVPRQRVVAPDTATAMQVGWLAGDAQRAGRGRARGGRNRRRCLSSRTLPQGGCTGTHHLQQTLAFKDSPYRADTIRRARCAREAVGPSARLCSSTAAQNTARRSRPMPQRPRCNGRCAVPQASSSHQEAIRQTPLRLRNLRANLPSGARHNTALTRHHAHSSRHHAHSSRREDP